MLEINYDDVHDVTGWTKEDVDKLLRHKSLPGIPVDASGQCKVSLQLSYLLVGAIFDRNQCLEGTHNDIILALESIDSEVHLPRIDSLKRHVLKRFQKAESPAANLKYLSSKVSILYPDEHCNRNPTNEFKNKDFLALFGKMSKNHTLSEIHNHILQIVGNEKAKSSDAALNNKYKRMLAMKNRMYKNKQNEELLHLLNSTFKLPSCLEMNESPLKRKRESVNSKQMLDFKSRLESSEFNLDITRKIMEDFKLQYELSLDEIYTLQDEIDELVNECCQQKHTIQSLRLKLNKIELKYRKQSEKLDETMQRYNYHEFRKFQKRECYHKKKIIEQKSEIKKLKLDTEKIDKIIIEQRKANKSSAYFKKQVSDCREKDLIQKRQILELQKDLSQKNKSINDLIEQINELLEDKVSVETFSDGQYLPSVRQVVQDIHSFGVGVKHIGQTIQSVLKHLIGVDSVKLPCESSNRRIVLESNLLTKLQVGEKLLDHSSNTLHFDGTTDAQKHFLGFQVSTSDKNLSLSMSETVRGDTQTQVDTLKRVFTDLADIMSSPDECKNHFGFFYFWVHRIKPFNSFIIYPHQSGLNMLNGSIWFKVSYLFHVCKILFACAIMFGYGD